MPIHSSPRHLTSSPATTRKVHFKALATDYDGTLAEDGTVSASTFAALRRAKEAGRRLVLVTGRELDDLMRVFPQVDIFDVVVAENGALLYTPNPVPQERPLATPPPAAFAKLLVERGVAPISCGRIIVATWEPHQHVVLETIRDLGLELEVIFNKGAVMVLPSGVNKASGLRVALEDLGLQTSEVVGVGDAENDHSLLEACGLGVAVANAVPALKDHADLVMSQPRGRGVTALIDEMLATDLAGIRRRTTPEVLGSISIVAPPERASAPRLVSRRSKP